MAPVSLRLHLIGLVAVGLAVSIAFGGALAGLGASRSVQTEMRSALAVARRAVENALAVADAGNPRRALESVIAAFEGNRHVRLRLDGDGDGGGAEAAPPVEEPAIGAVPAWFARWIDAHPTVVRVPVALGGRTESVVIETDPHNEVLEVWNAFGDQMLVLALFGAATFALIHVSVGRALRPLERLGDALREVGVGAYDTRVGGRLTPELARLADSFNRTARRLAEADAENRRLTERLLNLQEEERRGIARDLHDEVGPFLFAVNVDAAAIVRLAEAGHAPEIAAAARGITESVGHMQKQVRLMLGRLRPAGLADFGLAASLGHLVDFWRQRCPEIVFQLDLPPRCGGFGDLLDTTIYRLAQEGLSNAVRHGRPARVDVTVRAGGADGVLVEVIDDGNGAAAATGSGFGLVGMAERVRGLGGTLTSEARPGGGFAVRARLPRPDRMAAAAERRAAATA